MDQCSPHTLVCGLTLGHDLIAALLQETTVLTIWTYDWVPDGLRGYVCDFRLRWACEEARLAYDVKSVSFDERGPEHFARQPFGQIPFLEDDSLTFFESGACLLDLGRKSDTLMPRNPAGEAEVLEWTIAALNSIEMVSVPLMVVGRSCEGGRRFSSWLARHHAPSRTGRT